ncbi:MAG: efflux RND transporter periplasmic adaptor subunit, partial [Bdellovibrionota bacterium]
AFPEEFFDGKVTAIDSKVDENTRTIKVQATVNNPQGRLYPGMFVNLNLYLPPEPNTITLPQTAVTYTLYGDSAFIVSLSGKKDDKKQDLGTVKRIFVKTGDKQENNVVITEGIKAGDIVVNSGQTKLDDGTQIVINNSIPL